MPFIDLFHSYNLIQGQHSVYVLFRQHCSFCSPFHFPLVIVSCQHTQVEPKYSLQTSVFFSSLTQITYKKFVWNEFGPKKNQPIIPADAASGFGSTPNRAYLGWINGKIDFPFNVNKRAIWILWKGKEHYYWISFRVFQKLWFSGHGSAVCETFLDTPNITFWLICPCWTDSESTSKAFAYIRAHYYKFFKWAFFSGSVTWPKSSLLPSIKYLQECTDLTNPERQATLSCYSWEW